MKGIVGRCPQRFQLPAARADQSQVRIHFQDLGDYDDFVSIGTAAPPAQLRPVNRRLLSQEGCQKNLAT
jgi:hypothetical protein